VDDNEWGEDLGEPIKYGRRIPLWNRAAAQQKPQVYPRPQINFLMVAEGEDESQLASQVCLEPEKLHFYRVKKTDEVDTDLWPARAGVDFPVAPPPLTLNFRHEARSRKDLPEKPISKKPGKSVTRSIPGIWPVYLAFGAADTRDESHQ